jgi:outer membrane protein insertion porin family
VAYKIKEGDVFSVSEVNVHIAGEFPHTKQTVVLARVSQRPGDIIDMREIRNSERRLKASQLFAGTQNDGEPPRIVVRPPDLNSVNTVRGQEPDASRPAAATPPPRVAAQGVQPQPTLQSQPPQPVQVLKPCIYSWDGPVPVFHQPQPPQVPPQYPPANYR